MRLGGLLSRKTEPKKGDYDLETKQCQKKGKSKGDEKSKGTKKEGIMEFVVCITANPFSNRGAFCPIHPRVSPMERLR